MRERKGGILYRKRKVRKGFCYFVIDSLIRVVVDAVSLVREEGSFDSFAKERIDNSLFANLLFLCSI